MKRVVPVVVVVALALPATAAAAKREYSGAVKAASGSIEFTLKKRRATKKRPKRTSVRRFSFDEVPVTCEAGPGTTTGHLTFGMRVIDKRFDARGADGEGSNVRVKGSLKQKGRRVVGTLRLFGEVPLDPDARRGADCATGKLRWKAARA